MKKIWILMVFILVGICSCGTSLDLIGNENSLEGIRYNGVFYDLAGCFCAESDFRFLGYADNGASVYCIGSKKDPDYIQIVGSDNSSGYMKPGTSVPSSGTVTKVLVNPSMRSTNIGVVSKQKDLDAVVELTKVQGTVHNYTIENYGTDGNFFYFIYDGCNMATSRNYGGYIAVVGDIWIFVGPGNAMEMHEDNTAIVQGVEIQDRKLIDKLCQTDLARFLGK